MLFQAFRLRAMPFQGGRWPRRPGHLAALNNDDALGEGAAGVQLSCQHVDANKGSGRASLFPNGLALIRVLGQVRGFAAIEGAVCTTPPSSGEACGISFGPGCCVTGLLAESG